MAGERHGPGMRTVCYVWIGLNSSQRPLPDNTQHSKETDIHAVGGIRTRNPWKERPQTHTLDRAATCIGVCAFTKYSPFLLQIVHDEVEESWNSEHCQNLTLSFSNLTDHTFTMFDNTENRYIVGGFVAMIAWYKHTHLEKKHVDKPKKLNKFIIEMNWTNEHKVRQSKCCL